MVESAAGHNNRYPKGRMVNMCSKNEAVRRAIQHEYLRQLTDKGFTFGEDEKEPWGIQKSVMQTVSRQRFGRDRLTTNRTQVSEWVNRVRKNNYQVTSVQQDYTKSSQNRRKFHDGEIERIRNEIREKKLKCGELKAVYSDKKRKRVEVSESSVRRILKQPFRSEPSMVAAKPKGYRVGGNTAHHNKCRYIEAKWWLSLDQEEINGIWFADESKMTFR